MDHIVTRNMRDFEKSEVPPILPGDLIQYIDCHIVEQNPGTEELNI